MKVLNVRLVACAAVFILISAAARAATHTVSLAGGAAAVNAAIRDADENAIIVIAPSETPVTLTESIIIDKAVTVRGGGTDRSGVTLTAVSPSFPLVKISVAGASLENLTVAGVGGTSEIVQFSNNVASSVRDCAFTGNTVKRVIGLLNEFGQEPLVMDSLIADNTFSDEGGAAYGGRVLRCRILRNQATGNFSVTWRATCSDSLFEGNKGQPSTTQYGATYNCTFVGNYGGNKVVFGGTHFNSLYWNNSYTPSGNYCDGRPSFIVMDRIKSVLYNMCHENETENCKQCSGAVGEKAERHTPQGLCRVRGGDDEICRITEIPCP